MEDISAFLKGLPVINGEYEVGIAGAVDLSLVDELKLRVYTSQASIAGNAALSATWAFSKFTGKYRVYYAAAAYCAVMHGLARRGDGDSFETDEVLKPNVDLKFDLPEVRKAMSTIISTKVNMWLINHHVGQGKLESYAYKVAVSVYGVEAVDMEEYTKYAHTVGHWCSTREVLSKFGIGFILGTEPYHGDIPTQDKGISKATPGAKITKRVKDVGDKSAEGKAAEETPDWVTGYLPLLITDDARLRITSMPAGTHRHAVAAAIAKRLAGHYICKFSPVMYECDAILDRCNDIKESPAKYHIGAAYLTGARIRDFDDNASDSVMGRLITYAKYFMPNSTVVRSPHVSRSFGTSRSYLDVDKGDYSADYNDLLAKIREMESPHSEAFKKAFEQAVGPSPGIVADEFINFIRRKCGIKTPVAERAAEKHKAMSTESDVTFAEESSTASPPAKVHKGDLPMDS